LAFISPVAALPELKKMPGMLARRASTNDHESYSRPGMQETENICVAAPRHDK
jgi:hypothetical protein